MVVRIDHVDTDVNLDGILGDAEADTEGLVGVRGVGSGINR